MASEISNYTKVLDFDISEWLSGSAKAIEERALKVIVLSVENCMMRLVNSGGLNNAGYCMIPSDHIFLMWIYADTPRIKKWIELSVFCAYIDEMLASYKKPRYPDFVDQINKYQNLTKSNLHLNTLIKEYYNSPDYRLKRIGLLYLRCKYAILKKLSNINSSAKNFDLASKNITDAKQVLDLIHKVSSQVITNQGGLEDLAEQDDLNHKMEAYSGKDYLDKNTEASVQNFSTIEVIGDLLKEFLDVQNIIKIRENRCDYSGARIFGFMAYISVFNKDYESALHYADRALKKCPNEFWIEAKKAHAFMLMGNTEEASKFYLEKINQESSIDIKRIKDIILDDFNDLKTFGISHPMILEVSKLYKSK